MPLAAPVLGSALLALVLGGCVAVGAPGAPNSPSASGVGPAGRAGSSASGAGAVPTDPGSATAGVPTDSGGGAAGGAGSPSPGAGAGAGAGAGGAGGIPGGSGDGTVGGGVPASGALAAAWARLRPTLAARQVGLAILPVGAATGTEPVLLGEWRTGAAWSTSKVALSVAALAAATPAQLEARRTLARAAITESDNAAALALWAQLGGGSPAAAQVDAVLAAHGDPLTRTQAQQVRPPYTPFGQTTWSLAAQTRFAAGLVCDTGSSAVTETLALMGRISAGQRWGFGRLTEPVFKGGWGPGPDGGYLVRQFGVVTIAGHRYAVAVAALPRGGGFEQGIGVLDAVARWLPAQALTPGPGCPS